MKWKKRSVKDFHLDCRDQLNPNSRFDSLLTFSLSSSLTLLIFIPLLLCIAPHAFLYIINSVTRLGDFLHFGQLFQAFGNNQFAQISDILRQFLQRCQNLSFAGNFYRHLAIFIQSLMRNRIGPTAKHEWNVAIHVLQISFGFFTNTTAHRLGRYSLHFLLLKSCMDKVNSHGITSLKVKLGGCKPMGGNKH